MADMRRVLRAKAQGENIRLSVHRDGVMRDITTTLGEASPCASYLMRRRRAVTTLLLSGQPG
jgi:hypothetical protein